MKNKENSLAVLRQDLAKEWHPWRNGDLKPEDVTCGSNKKVWWLLVYKDQSTGKVFNFEWESSIKNRVNGCGCPYLAKCCNAIYVGFNDLATTHKELCREWHPTKNGDLLPTQVTAGSHKKVWWHLPYDDVVTGKHFDFEWMSVINHRTRGMSCPFLSSRARDVWPGFNDLATTHPELVKEWNYKKNGELKPTEVSAGSEKIVWWTTIVDNIEYEWKSMVCQRALQGQKCPGLHISKFEKLIQEILKKKSIAYKKEVSTNDCLSQNKRKLRFDFSVNNMSHLIECDGEQHFLERFFFGEKQEFEIRVKNDNTKNKYAFSHNVPLLRIPYTYHIIKDENKIRTLVLEFIETKIIPQEIIDFYSRFEFSNYAEYAKNHNEKIKKTVTA